MSKAIFAVLVLLLPFAARAQEAVPLQTAVPASYTQQQIDQMTAPIALYPDPLVGQVLMAATYPLEVVEASRWLQNPQNARLSGDALQAALAQQPWDPSVKSLIAFPQVLSMMNNNLQWTEQLGDAFLAQQPAVMDSVQRLRQMAQASGNLASTPQQAVANDAGAITIEPANPQIVYVPSYDPDVVYGVWPYPDYQPYYFPFPGVYVAGVIGFGVGIAVTDWLWGWDHWDWHSHRIDIDDRRFAGLGGHALPESGAWRHDPAHRHGVPYASPAARARFQGAADQARRNFRGYAASPGIAAQRQPSFVRQAPEATSAARVEQPRMRQAAPSAHIEQPRMQQAAPAFESFSRGSDVRAQSQRGAYSRSTMPSAPARSAPAFHAAPSAGGGVSGGGHNGSMRVR